LPAARQGEVLREIGGQELLVLRKPIEGAEGGNLQVNAFAAEAAGGFFRLVGEGALALVLEEGHQVVELN
jgi:hypothetical protein